MKYSPFHNLATKFFGPTNHRGARIKADAGDGRSLTISYDYASGNRHADAARALCVKMGWTGTLVKGGLAGKGGNVYVFSDRGAETFTV